jgi:hypothetical protein
VRAFWAVAFGAGVFGCGVIAAGCGSPAASNIRPATLQTPKQATVSWFAAVTETTKAIALADFEPKARDMMEWGGGRTSTWPTFSDVRCKTLIRTASEASVYCTFSESDSPAVGNPDTFWTVYVQRNTNRRWLISDYGQP